MSIEYGGYTDKIADNIVNANFEDIEKDALENAKLRILDVTGCIIGGMNGFGNRHLITKLKDWGGKQESSIFMYGGKIPAQQAAMANCVIARSYDFESIRARVNGQNLPSHISGTTVPTALTLADAVRCSGKELIIALLLGDDFSCRLLAASGFDFVGGWDGVGTVNAFGATAIAARLLGLTKDQTVNALGIVLNKLAGSFQGIYDGASTFKLLQGFSAQNGVVAAEYAKIGLTGVSDALMSKFGYFALYTGGCSSPSILIENLGKVFHTEQTFKLYPCCRSTHDSVEAALKLIGENDVDVDQISKITLRVPASVLNMFVSQPWGIRTAPQIDAAFNVRYCVANVLLRKGILLEHFLEDTIREEAISKIVDKISLIELEKPFAPDLGASLSLEMDNGRIITAEADYPKGEPELYPAAKNELIEKFYCNVAFSKAIDTRKADRILDLIERFEEIEDVGELTGLLICDN